MATPTKAPRSPQDHKPKAGGAFTFDHGGTTYEIPAPSEALATIPGRAFRDAMLEGEAGQLKFSLVCLEAAGATPEALDALYAKPTPEMLDVVGRWMSSADQSGATLPQS